MSTASLQTPFLDVKSFVAEEEAPIAQEEEAFGGGSPFISLYSFEEESVASNPEAEDYTAFLSELYDEELDEALYELASEAASLHDQHVESASEDSETASRLAERFLEQHFAPLAEQIETLLDTMAEKFGEANPAHIPENEVDQFLDSYAPSRDLQPSFEEFFKKFRRKLAGLAKGAVRLAKRGIRFVGKFALGPLLKKLKALIRPLLNRVLKLGIRKLPVTLQPAATALARRMGVLKETEEEEEQVGLAPSVTAIQQQFDQQLTDLLFAGGEVEQDLEVAEIVSQSQLASDSSFANLEDAREQFIIQLGQLKDGEDPTPLLEEFVPAVLPALKLGLRIIGRRRVVNLLANLLARLIRRFTGPQLAPNLSRALVDAGLRLMNLEMSQEDEQTAANAALAATVEDTVRRVAALPEHILDNEDLLESFAVEAMEEAAAANLPPLLSEEVYRRRPHLRESIVLRGTWCLHPLRRGRRKRPPCKKFTKVHKVRINPHKARATETFGGVSLSDFLDEQLGFAPGEEVEAEVHLFETLPGTQLSDIAREEGLGDTPAQGVSLLHPLTPEAAATLLDEPGLGKEVEARHLADPYTTDEAQRLYYLKIPRAPLLTVPGAAGRRRIRRPSGLKTTLDFRRNEIRCFLFLSEKRAQEIAALLRRPGHVRGVLEVLRPLLHRDIENSVTGRRVGRLRMIHEALLPQRAMGPALGRVPALVLNRLKASLHGWLYQPLAAYFRERAADFIAKTEDPREGVTLVITIANPPGFPQLRQALAGRMPPLAGFSFKGAPPTVTVAAVPEYAHG